MTIGNDDRDNRDLNRRPQPPIPGARPVARNWMWAVAVVAALLLFGVFYFGTADRTSTTADNPPAGMGTTGQRTVPAPTPSPSPSPNR